MSELYHYGVKGMKWGVRRYTNEDGSLTPRGIKRYVDYNKGGLTRKGRKRLKKVGANSAEGKYIRRAELDANVSSNWYKSYNKATDEFNIKINEINSRFGNKATTDNKKYVAAVGKEWTNLYSKALISDFGSDPITKGTEWVANAPFMDVYENFK
jgi:hypothetical protein